MPSKTIEDFAYQVRDYMRSAEVVEGKNLFPPTVYPLGIPTTSTGTSAFNDTPTATMFISKVDNNTDYVISRSTGDRFRIALSVDMPAVDVVCNVIINDPSLDDAQFNSGNYNYVAFFVNNASPETADVIEPMLCTLTDWNKSHTYEPYYVPVKDSKFDIADQQVLGAWNQLENNLVSTTVNGVTYTKESDGTVDVTGQVTTGQTFAHAEFITTKTYPAGTYFYSDGLEGAGHKGTVIRTDNSSGTVLINTMQNITSFTLTEPHKLYVRFYRDSNETGNYTIKPMLAPEPNQTYVPYAMTNQELTAKVQQKIIAEAAANQTWAAQLTSLWSTFSALSYADRTRCNLYTLVNGNLYDKYALANTGYGTFEMVTITGDGLSMNTNSVIMQLGLYYIQKIKTANSEVSILNLSSNTNNLALALVME